MDKITGEVLHMSPEKSVISTETKHARINCLRAIMNILVVCFRKIIILHKNWNEPQKKIFEELRKQNIRIGEK